MKKQGTVVRRWRKVKYTGQSTDLLQRLSQVAGQYCVLREKKDEWSERQKLRKESNTPFGERGLRGWRKPAL